MREREGAKKNERRNCSNIIKEFEYRKSRWMIRSRPTTTTSSQQFFFPNFLTTWNDQRKIKSGFSFRFVSTAKKKGKRSEKLRK